MKSGYKDSLSQYADLVNQPTLADELGNAYSKAGNQTALGPAQRSTNALLLGIGAGMKGAANEERRQQLSPMLEQAGQITAQAAELEMQTQQAQQSKMQFMQLFQQTAVPLAQLSQASLAGDINASNQLAKGVYTRFKQGLGDPSMGDFDHYHNGTIYYENPESGVIEGRNIIGLMYQAGINPIEIWGQDAPMIEAGFSPGAKKNYENTEQMRQLEMQSKQADIDNKYSQTRQHNASADKTNYEMNNPTKENGSIDPVEMEEELDVLSEQVEKIGKAGEQDAGSRIMSELTPGHVYQLTPEQTAVDTLGQLIRGQMFKAFGYRNQTEFEQIPSISSNNSVEQNKAIIQQYKNLFLKHLDGSGHSIRMIGPEGEFDVPAEKVELFERNGYK